ncbi:MAG: helix-turn-helix domain-containing protein, partial [Acidobacteriota bacterium]
MKELSELLRSERQRRNLTIGDVSARTCLSPGVLEALEAGEYERIGAPILIRGFVRAYCSA